MVKFDNIIFFNYYHNGDIHVGRSYVKWIIDNVFANNYIYQHKHSDRLLLDLKKLSHTNKITGNSRLGIYIKDNDLYVNTWFNSKGGKFYSGCNINSLHDYFKNDIKEVLNFDIGTKYDFIPEIDFSVFDIDKIDIFMKKLGNKKKIFISSGDAASGQSNNQISMVKVVDNLSRTYKDMLFFLSNRLNYKADNVIYNDDLVDFKFNLNENGYISTFCDINIGRFSGPQSYSYIKENFYSNKIYLLLITDTVNDDIDFGLKNINTK